MVDRKARSHARRLVAGVVVLVWALASSSPALGQRIENHLGQAVHAVELEGVPEELVAPLEAGLALATRSGLLRTKRPPLRKDAHQQDVDRIRLFLARHGFPFAEISTRYEEAGRDRVKVVFVVGTGPPVSYGRVVVTGEPPSMQEADERAEDLLVTGETFDDAAVQTVAGVLESAIHEAGHARGTVDLRLTRIDSVTVDVEFVIEAGDPYRIDALSVSGVTDDLKAVALRTMNVEPGTPYSPSVVREARENLQSLGLFRQIQLETKEISTQSLELVADLSQADPRTISLSVGSWTDDVLRFQARWTHRNLLRRGRGVEALGLYTQWRRQLSARTWWPGLLSPRSTAELTVGTVVEDEESYYLVGSGVGVSNSVRSTARRSWRVGIEFTDVDFEARSDNVEEFLANPGRQIILSSRWHDDRSSDLIDPTTGTRLTLDGHFSSPGLSESPFVSGEANVVKYLPTPGGTVLAIRFNFGVAKPMGDAIDLLPNFRFFAGGVSSMRGYERRKLGPVDDDGKPVGGEARFLGSGELRFPLYRALKGSVFMDTGQVWRRYDEINIDGIQVAVGPGLLVMTPVGPIRVDYATLLTEPLPGRSRNQFQFAIGHPF